jgi:hypothetical protein
MVSFQNIAVFILSTTVTNGRYKQDYPTYYESRIVPIMDTWGMYFPTLFFVFGSNRKDYDFLTDNCELQALQPSRLLKAQSEQIASQNIVKRFECPAVHGIESHVNSTSLRTKFNVLYTGNCTGEYFGIGPTCRCQESMRYFNQEPSMSRHEWFIFIDDDIHFRPHSLRAMLSGFHPVETMPVNITERGVALVGTRTYRGFRFSKREPPHNCSGSAAYDFPIAQPAIINRYAHTHT